ncbi:hypothetical protein PCK2_000251 [Pneumocystis canis]|nr:hypothetical protein PCK2_000251 [Pneumocystis canis]
MLNIGYSRILLATASLKYMPYHPKYCTWLYILSCLLDAFDGMAARWLGQGVLKMILILNKLKNMII